MNHKSLVFYSSFLLVVYGPIPVSIAIGLMLLSCVYLCIKDQQTMVVLPFYLFPFMFLLRARDPNNLILTVLPDLSAMVTVVYLNAKNQSRYRSKSICRILNLYCYVSVLVPLMHMMEIVYLPLIIRQYLLPIVFLITLIDEVGRTSGLIDKLYKISFYSFALVAAMSVLNYLSLLTVEPSIIALEPYLNYSQLDPENSVGRSFAGGESLARLNLFTGGALGSSAAIFFYLSFSPFLYKNLKMNLCHILFSVVLGVSSILSSSFSIVSSVVIGLGVLLFKVNKSFASIGFLCLLQLLVSVPLFFDTSAIDYFSSSIGTGFIEYLNVIKVEAILFGSGPRFTSMGYEFQPDNFIIDAGFVRVFVEFGLVAFLPFSCFIFSLLAKRFFYPNDLYLKSYDFFFGFCLLFLVCVHANMTSLPPFYPLFSIIVGGLIPTDRVELNRRSR